MSAISCRSASRSNWLCTMTRSTATICSRSRFTVSCPPTYTSTEPTAGSGLKGQHRYNADTILSKYVFFKIIVTSAAHRHCLQVTHSFIFQFCAIFLSVFAHVSHPYRRVDNTTSYALMIIYLVFIGQCRAVIVFSTLLNASYTMFFQDIIIAVSIRSHRASPSIPIVSQDYQKENPIVVNLFSKEDSQISDRFIRRMCERESPARHTSSISTFTYSQAVGGRNDPASMDDRTTACVPGRPAAVED